MSNFSLIAALRASAFGLFLNLSLMSLTHAQNQKQAIFEWLQQKSISAPTMEAHLFQRAKQPEKRTETIGNAAIFNLDENALSLLREAAPERINLVLPTADKEPMVLELAKVDIFGPDFKVGTLGTLRDDHVPYQSGTHYRGIIRGKPGSVVSVSLLNSGVMGLIADETGNYNLGEMEDGTHEYIFYRSADLPVSNPLHCMVTAEQELVEHVENAVEERGGACGGAVQIYFECDYKLFTDKGADVTLATDYVTGLFNQIATLYAKENITVVISEVYIWSSPDPYAAYGSTASVLNVFRSTKGVNYNGNIAHFLTTRNLGGGIAYLDVICSKSSAFGVSAISTTYKNAPIYSWSVEVVTHELGHNLGSPHTQSCSWPGGPIDNCFGQEGSCSPGPAPVNGGTIMSYCHLTSYGIDLANGFGPLPGDRIRSRVAAGTCLSAGSGSGAAPTGMNTSNIAAAAATLTWASTGSGSTYIVQYKTNSSTTWQTSNPQSTTTLTLTALAPSTVYNWKVKSGCSPYSSQVNFTTIAGSSNCSIPTGLATSNIAANTARCAWTTVVGTVQYTVEFKLTTATTWTTAGTSAVNNYVLSGLLTNKGYDWRVKANCSAFSSPINFTTTQTSTGGGGSTTCAAPSGLTHSILSSSSARLNWSAVPNAGSYVLQIRRQGAATWYSLGSTTLISVRIINLTPGITYEWRVKAVCSVYSAIATITTPPAMPATMDDIFSKNPAITLFPNPTNGLLNVRFSGNLPENGKWFIFDATGRRLKQIAAPLEFGLIDVSELQSGVYFLGISGSNIPVPPQRFAVIR